jgi:hypothetical protein
MRLIMELVALEGGYGTKLGNSNADDVKVDKPSKNAIDDDVGSTRQEKRVISCSR